MAISNICVNKRYKMETMLKTNYNGYIRTSLILINEFLANAFDTMITKY